MKACKDCGEVKLLAAFYAHPDTTDRHLHSCKECRKEYARKRQDDGLRQEIDARKYQKRKKNKPETIREYNRRYRANHPEADRAHRILNYHVRAGNIASQPCQICGRKAHAHHRDYSKPLEVDWLCPRHHSDEHRKDS